MVDRRLHRRRRPEYEEQILPLAAAELAGCRRVLDVGCGDGQISRLAAGLPASTSRSASTRRGTRSRSPAERGGGAGYARAGADGLPFADGSFDAVVACLVFEHIDDVDEAIAEVARVLEPGGRFCFFLNHPLLQTPGSGWIDDQIARSARAVLADRPVPRRGGDDRGGRARRLHPLRPPAAVALRQHARRPRPAARADGRAGAAAGFLALGAGVRASGDRSPPAVPPHGRRERRSRRRGIASLDAAVAEIVLITGLSGAGRSAAADVLEDLGWYVVDNLPTSLVETIVELASKPGSGIERLALVVRPPPRRGARHGRRAARRRAPGDACCSSTPDAELVRRYDATRRKHPLADEADGLVESIELERRAAAAAPATPPTWSSTPPTSTSTSSRSGSSPRSTTPARRSCRSRSRASASSTACRSTPTS